MQIQTWTANIVKNTDVRLRKFKIEMKLYNFQRSSTRLSTLVALKKRIDFTKREIIGIGTL